MIRARSDTETEFNRDLAEDRRKLRRFHDLRSAQRPDEHHYRGLTLRREHNSESQTYELLDDGEPLGSVEIDAFQNRDDLVRFVDAAVNHDFDAAIQWVRNELNWGWSQ